MELYILITDHITTHKDLDGVLDELLYYNDIPTDDVSIHRGIFIRELEQIVKDGGFEYTDMIHHRLKEATNGEHPNFGNFIIKEVRI